MNTILNCYSNFQIFEIIRCLCCDDEASAYALVLLLSRATVLVPLTGQSRSHVTTGGQSAHMS
jgi:hypothetical protein